MFLSSSVKSTTVCEKARGFSHCLILNTLKQPSLKQSSRTRNEKGLSKRRTKKAHIVIKRESDDIETVWLENLNNHNLKLFRKTSFDSDLLKIFLHIIDDVEWKQSGSDGKLTGGYGSFRKINLQNLFEKLKEIYPKTFGNEHSIAEAANKKSQLVQPQTESVTDVANSPPCLSDYMIKHIMQFPMLKSENGNSVCEAAQTEIEAYGDVDVVMFPSVTGILNETMSSSSRLKLKQWKERMIGELGEEGFQKHQADLLAQGSKFHSTLKTYLELPDKTLVTVDPQIEGCWQSLEKLLPDISDVRFVEESIHHPILMYKGIVDCVAAYKGTPCVIEWKKSTKPKPSISSTYDAPLQLCAYLGALPWQKNLTVENGLLVVAYTDGTPANVFRMSPDLCQIYWNEWLRRVQSYWLKKSPTIVQAQM